MSEETEEIKFNLFPDTGHHYLFIPLKDRGLAQAQAESKVWHWIDSYPWLLWRSGEKNGESGIWLCAETNQGTTARAVFSKDGEHGDGNPPEESKSPYVAESSSGSLGNKRFSLPVDTDKKIRIEWQKAGGKDPLDVDLIVDFGNTRTTVLALEHKQEKGRTDLVDCCKSVLFLRRGEEFDGESLKERNNEDSSRKIVDSWFVLREPEFSEQETRYEISRYETGMETRKAKFFGKKNVPVWQEKKYTAQMFVEVSPTVMGSECEERLRQSNLGKGEFFTMSSPKRFLWDNEVGAVGREGNMEWGMLSRRSDADVKTLSGTICRYTYENGRDWEIDNPPFMDKNDRPTSNPKYPGFPRREAMVWAALNILETAFREITSFKWRERDVQGIVRRVKTVSLTFPSGWVADEMRAYERAWKRAADIFALSHFANPKADRPEVKMEVDEAVASQLPFVYSEIRRLGGDVSAWIRLFGKGESARVMTIDVGGGTMDVSVVEYRDHCADAGISGAHLEYKLLFRDCNTNAGDNAVKRIIEKLLLPGIFNCCDRLQGDDVDGNRRKFKGLFGKSPSEAADRAIRSRIAKLVFVPVVRRWLGCLCSGNTRGITTGDDGRPMSIEDLIGEVGRDALVDLERLLGETFGGDTTKLVLDTTRPISFDAETAKKCIRDVLDRGITPIAKIIAALDVDIVTVSGKITEIPDIRDMLQERLPVPGQRIVTMKNYMAGNWYPMSQEGRIADAKTVTVVGAALLRAIRNGLIDGWTIKSDGDLRPPPNYWGVLPASERGGFQGDKKIITPTTNASEDWFRIRIGSRIGRLSVPSRISRPEQVYELRWTDFERRKQGNKTMTIIEAKFRREISPQGESLVLTEVRGLEGEPRVDLGDVELKLCTMERERFWLDEGCFNVRFEEN